MSSAFKKAIYVNSVEKVATLDFIPYKKLRGSAIVVSGSTGLIGSFLVDTIMYLNKNNDLDCKIYAFGRNEDKAQARFTDYWDDESFEFVLHDVNMPITLNTHRKKNYILHLASNTHPKAYASNPISTITTNIIGTENMLKLAEELSAPRFVFASSCEVYGENRDGTREFSEDYCGYIDCNTLRAGYPESKRCGEALCQAYLAERGIDVVIPRLSRVYGPTMSMGDSKAMSQFLKNGLSGDDIVLKSSGEQLYSYLYVADAVSGILKVMLDGKSGEAYNLAYSESNVKLRDLAQKIADITGTNVVFGEASKDEKAGFSKAQVAVLNAEKANKLGWVAMYDIDSGVRDTLEILS